MRLCHVLDFAMGLVAADSDVIPDAQKIFNNFEQYFKQIAAEMHAPLECRD